MLRQNPFFCDLAPQTIEGLSRLCSLRSLEKGTTLFQKGDPGEALYGIRRGQVAIETGQASGERVTLALLGSGDVFGEIALLDGKVRTADAVVIEPTDVFALYRRDLMAYIAREPLVGIKFIEMLCGRLRSMSGQIEQGLFARLDARLATRLLILADDFGDEIEITQEQLARHVGATRESVNRQLRAWQKAGFLDIRRNCIVIRHAAGVKACVGR